MKLSVRFTLSILLCLTLFSCSQTSGKLNIAEQLMATAPDSALHILQKLKPNLFTIHSDRALYALLMSQALDKNDIKVESDSLISIATKYYDENDPVHAGYAWFYRARCANNRGDAKTQADALLKAQEFAEKTDNDKLMGLVYLDKGSMYSTQRQYKNSIYYFKCAFQRFSKIKDYRNCILSSLNIGYNYLYTPHSEKAINYYLLAEKQFSHYKDTLLLSTVYRCLGGYYYQKENFKQALGYYHKVPLTHQSIYDSNNWFLVANIYYRIGNFDSTRLYLNKINRLQEMAPDYYRLWQTINEKEGNTTKALYYAKQVTLATDSLYKRKLDISFAGLEKKYKYQSLQLSNKELIIKNKQNSILLLITLFLLSLGVLIVLSWRNRVKNHQLKIQKKLLEHEKNLVEKEKENINLLEQQLKMQNILLSNVEQYKNHSVKRPDGIDKKRHGVSPILNQTFHDELIACMDIQYNNISKRLKDRFQDLTERDILICCLLLAEFESGMIATILDVKNDSIRIHRTRLRKKLGLETSENLTLYLSQF
jgi:DNA-binding CsgD family transcriptional regulator